MWYVLVVEGEEEVGSGSQEMNRLKRKGCVLHVVRHRSGQVYK
jgi:hypothetical protein